ncbi:hypothetical protein [Methylobacterium sp. 37f]|uniref:hypothetical protein n=1 Tax=Methylobacterium sp. 37f TaxID=2817058 RepID=UPI001FFD0C4A|nr:hypothetical protein [Methylobacterium sp. 37f]MCK2055262.1 hypothetical protein [Methylobacterium sp. 37f]
MGIASTAGRLGGCDAIVRTLQKTTAFAIEQYESKNSSRKLPDGFKKVLDSFIEMYIGTMIDVILAGKLDKSAARTALVRCFKSAGIADDTSTIDCGVALFSVGVTAQNSIKNTVTAARVAGIASASGVGAAPGAILVVATFTYGVFATYKDGTDAAKTCDEAISKWAEKLKRPAATIDGKGYGVGPVSIHIRNQRGPATSFVGNI